MRLYEAMWICDTSKGKEDVSKITGELKEMIEKAGGEVVNCEKWLDRRLAYPIRDANRKKHRRGLYCLSHFNAPSDSVAKLERAAKLSDLVLRVLIVKDEDGTDLTPPDDSPFTGRFKGGDRDRDGGGRGHRDSYRSGGRSGGRPARNDDRSNA